MLRGGGLAILGAGAATVDGAPECNCSKAADGSPLDTSLSELRPMIERYDADLRDLHRVYPMAGSNTRHARLERYLNEQAHLLGRLRSPEPIRQSRLSAAARPHHP